MSRQRVIVPQITTSPSLMAVSVPARWLFVCMIATADDYGRGRAGLLALTALAFPNDEPPVDVLPLLQQLERQDLIRTYGDAAGNFYSIPRWGRYQNPRHVRPSSIPKPPANQRQSAADSVAKGAQSAGASTADRRRTDGALDTGPPLDRRQTGGETPSNRRQSAAELPADSIDASQELGEGSSKSYHLKSKQRTNERSLDESGSREATE